MVEILETGLAFDKKLMPTRGIKHWGSKWLLKHSATHKVWCNWTVK